MIRKIIRKVKLLFNPPKSGDTYYADPLDFVIGRPLEKILHGMKTYNGDTAWETIPSKLAYKLTITSDGMPYYICEARVLAENCNNQKKDWLLRSQPRRIPKSKFIDWIVEGKLEKL